MSDLSEPPAALVTADRPAFAWPTPDLAGYSAATPLTPPPACRVEGLNGHSLQGRLLAFDPARGTLQLRMHSQRKPLNLRLDQFRRLELLDALRPMPQAPARPGTTAAAELPRALLPFEIALIAAAPWRGRTLGWHEEAFGVFLFEPLDEAGSVRRWFVPRPAFTQAELGVRIGQALVDQDSASPDQIRQALAEQESLRSRKLGEMLVVRQIITPAELNTAIEQQARMPMVRIGEALTTLGFLSETQLEDALVQQRSDRSVPLGELLVRRGMVSRADLQTALARKMGYPLVDVLQFPADAEALSRLPYPVAARMQALPLLLRAGRLVVALEDPSSRRNIEELEFAAHGKVVPVLARSGVLPGAIDRAYGKVASAEPAPAPGLAGTAGCDARAQPAQEADIQLGQGSLQRWIDKLIVDAHSQGTSDIHIECPPGQDPVRIRWRKHGRLQTHQELPPTCRSALIDRLKQVCGLDATERRQPQEGRADGARLVPGMQLQLRLTTIPTQDGLEDAVLRLVAPGRPLPLEDLGLSPRNLDSLQAEIRRPCGMLLCVGPAGAGTTTTVHALLAQLNTPERKIWTAEDPVEITQAGLRQVQVDPLVDWTFAKALRTFVRADADVIMVGEIRDRATAQAAIEASLAGRLVLSTLRTGNATETVARLLEMGIDPFQLGDALLGVLAQRLVRRLCTHCRTVRDASPEEEEELLLDHSHARAGQDAPPASPTPPAAADVLADWRHRFGTEGRLPVYRSVGCAHCGGSGYHGRVGIHELMPVTRALRHLIHTGGRADQLLHHAQGEGMHSLRQDGIEKLLAGVTSLEEVRANS